MSRRNVGFCAFATLLLARQPAEAAIEACKSDPNAQLVAPRIAINSAPNQSEYNAADPVLREAAALLQQGLNAEDVITEEKIWTEIIQRYSDVEANWVPDVVGRAYGNRGNARSRQGKLEAALQDYNCSIAICPWSVDPVLNRGVVLEALDRFEEAIADYRAVLEVAPNDPAAWNNLGNASAGLGRWKDAEQYYGRAASLAPSFSFAAANRALALYQLGETEASIREMRTLLRRYMDFPDMRAALAAALWGSGREADAENNWQRVDDPRYKDRQWLRQERRWPPRLIESLEAFLDLKSV